MTENPPATPIHDPAFAAAITDWLRTREHAAIWALQELRGTDPDDVAEILDVRDDPRVQARSHALAVWHTTRSLTAEQVGECWQYYANEARRTSRALTQLDHTPDPGRPAGLQADEYRAAILGHLTAVEAAIQTAITE